MFFRSGNFETLFYEDREDMIVYSEGTRGRRMVLNMIIDIVGYTVHRKKTKENRHYLAEVYTKGADPE